ncbi:MAG: hypothetical protein K2O67_02705, partial [Clostridia bacterium]|nr:hypothetical protein [Clostridia bacterium]
TCGHNVKDGEAAHSWNDGEITKEATCTAEGVKTFTCSVCNKTRTETLEKIAHTPESVAAVDPDCTNTGLTEGSRCSVCNQTLTAQNVVPALGHDYQAVEGGGTPPTCTTPGNGKVKCSRCNDEQEGDSIPALGHNAGEEATCTEPQKCTVCGTELAPALGHDWSTVWSKDATNHWHICSRCDEKNGETAHTYDCVITKDPTEDEEGEKEERCTVCEYANGNKETLAKLVVDDNGSVGDLPELPPNQDYDLEIAVKESESKYNIEGLNKGYLVELFIVDGEDRNPYDDSKDVTLKLVIPDGMDDFTLYRMSGDRLTEISSEEYTVSDGVVTIRTTLPSEFVFNAPIPEQPSAGIPWWVWLIVGLVVVAIVGVIIVIIVVAKKKN